MENIGQITNVVKLIEAEKRGTCVCIQNNRRNPNDSKVSPVLFGRRFLIDSKDLGYSTLQTVAVLWQKPLHLL